MNKDYSNIFNKTWKGYDRKYIEYVNIRTQICFLSIMSNYYFKDFPSNMPKDLFSPVLARLHVPLVKETEKRGITRLNGLENIDEVITNAEILSKIKFSEFQNKLMLLMQGLHYNSRFLLKIPEFKYPDFIFLQLSQEILSIVSIAEGFIYDTLWLIFENSIEYKELNIREKEEKIFDMTRGNILKKINKISTIFGLGIKIDKRVKNDLNKLICIRNILVHNNSKINQKYIQLFKTERTIGETLKLSAKDVEYYLDQLGDVMYNLYAKVSLNVLKKKEDEILPLPCNIQL